MSDEAEDSPGRINAFEEGPGSVGNPHRSDWRARAAYWPRTTESSEPDHDLIRPRAAGRIASEGVVGDVGDDVRTSVTVGAERKSN